MARQVNHSDVEHGTETNWSEPEFPDDYNPDFEPMGWRVDYQDYWIERYGSMYINDPYEGWIILSQEERIRDYMRDNFFRSVANRHRYQARLAYNAIMRHCLDPIASMFKALKKDPGMILDPGEAELKALARLANSRGPLVINGWTWERPRLK